MTIKGKPMPILFTVTARFKLKEKELPEDFIAGAFILEDKGQTPRLIVEKKPEYPEEARKKGIQGAVILKIRVDREGNVEAVKVVKSESLLLNDAAIEAVKQWKYEPFLLQGEATPVVFAVTVRFMMK
jgi:TonB family protein